MVMFKLRPLICTEAFSKIWPNDLVFDPMGPSLNFIYISLRLTFQMIFYEDHGKNKATYVHISFSKIQPND